MDLLVLDSPLSHLFWLQVSLNSNGSNGWYHNTVVTFVCVSLTLMSVIWFLGDLSSCETMATVRKKVDNRIRVQIENGVALQHRTMFVVVGDRGRDQVRLCLLLLSWQLIWNCHLTQFRHMLYHWLFVMWRQCQCCANQRFLCWSSRWLFFITCCPKLQSELGLLSSGATRRTWVSAGRFYLLD